MTPRTRPNRTSSPSTGHHDRAVSTPLGYVLTLAITTVLISGLLIAMGGFVDGQRERVVRSELEVLGEQVAADVSAADRLVVAGGTDTDVRASFRLPERVGGSAYTVELTDSDAGDDAATVTLHSADPEVTVEVTFRTRTDVQVGAPVQGGNLVVEYDETDSHLEVHAGD
ncbi:hypothetical protein ACFO0N_02805 [Halobium salinum]|uniref:Secreted glycoprotein n=1 Tax=Halobium salinum TaxID=1364940 RepID=A0ABD5P830_9EURY|nr:hypothetical protein [Halobium salinum]